MKEGDNVLITGIGGGVALIAMQLCLARGANVYVSSSNEDKVRKAVELGAKGGVNYKHKDWPAQLQKLLEKNHGKGALLSSVIDSGGGDIMGQAGKILKGGGKVVVYGMLVACDDMHVLLSCTDSINRTASPKISLTMREVLKNQQLIGKPAIEPVLLMTLTYFSRLDHGLPPRSHRRYEFHHSAQSRSSCLTCPGRPGICRGRFPAFGTRRPLWKDCDQAATRRCAH